MNIREINAALKTCTVRIKGIPTIKPEKARELDSDVRAQVTRLIVRNRKPVLVDLLPDQPDISWLAACGYRYRTTSSSTNLRFLHTCEHVIK